MKKEKSTAEPQRKEKDIFNLNISVDCTIFGFHSGSLKVLLCKPSVGEKWMLPGGLITRDEIPDETARRILKAKTGLSDTYLKQFSFFGRKDKKQEENENPEILSEISLAYFALIKSGDAQLVEDNDTEHVEWFEINNISDLHPEHKIIFETALSTLRKQIGFIPIGYELLPEKFTMPELRSIYEAILGRELDRRNFQRKMLSIGFIKALNETRKVGAHKSPNLYSFDKKKYEEAERLGIQLMSNNL